ncbi:unnamed protein product (macronuclear) [Paramecium tetraurelia]|uniref:Uncharacterized protein n=1 Tax=Paramecium tetraurelia TaxID=5888 RepID=A0DZE3_PARTE|nr:uncharacterized protein GSPATT00021577001 [Paramecium tetraurelia]CAK88410.1 unnamed protein product [Paramecium tetraurelia]|eukprot:XP_001455807.1 hypothetical protein (macronuclear) [Paramecium tetraurelia strain d4-2]
MGKNKANGKKQFQIIGVNSKAQAYEFGEYKYDQIKGTWKQFYKEQQVCQGEYNDFGEKSGIWREFWPGFWEKSFAIYNGEYKKGKKLVNGKFY